MKNEQEAPSGAAALKEGTIVFDDGQCTMKCKILDISKTGVRLHVPNMMLMPEQVLFKIRYGAIRNGEVIWKKGPTVGRAVHGRQKNRNGRRIANE